MSKAWIVCKEDGQWQLALDSSDGHDHSYIIEDNGVPRLCDYRDLLRGTHASEYYSVHAFPVSQDELNNLLNQLIKWRLDFGGRKS